MEQENDNLGNLLSEVVEQAQSEQIVYIDIDELEENPRNFYGLRDIEVLAGLIAVSHLIEPLTVIKTTEGRYRIISGHRRYAAFALTEAIVFSMTLVKLTAITLGINLSIFTRSMTMAPAITLRFGRATSTFKAITRFRAEICKV